MKQTIIRSKIGRNKKGDKKCFKCGKIGDIRIGSNLCRKCFKITYPI